MCSLDNITEFLDVDLEGIRLRNGKKRPSKNKYYFLRDTGYIVCLGGDRWMILDNSDKTRELLTNHTWGCNSGYAESTVQKGSPRIRIHRLVSECPDGLMTDHRNRLPYDNRLANLRNVTARTNQRNRTKRTDNTSGKQGISRRIINRTPYFEASVINDNGKRIYKYFSVIKLGEADAKRQAIAQRVAWEQQFNYIGE
jgi:hypothetical protein